MARGPRSMRPEGGLSQPRRATGVPILPPHGRGLRIGLLGGSFNPPHEGHRLISLTALRRLSLDAVWWLVTPGNPLKDNSALPTLDARMAVCRTIADHPAIHVSGVERRLGTRYTYQTLVQLKRLCPGVRFVWLMGADNLRGFHRWQNWLGIARLVPIGVIDRPGATLKAMRSRAALRMSWTRLPEHNARALPTRRAPAYVFLHGRRSALSSTALRSTALRPTALRGGGKAAK